MALQGGNQGAHFLRENGGISQQNHRQGKDEGPQSGCAVKIIDQDKSQYDGKGQKRSKLKHAAGDGTAADERAADDEHHLDGGTDYAQYDAGSPPPANMIVLMGFPLPSDDRNSKGDGGQPIRDKGEKEQVLHPCIHPFSLLPLVGKTSRRSVPSAACSSSRLNPNQFLLVWAPRYKMPSFQRIQTLRCCQ